MTAPSLELDDAIAEVGGAFRGRLRRAAGPHDDRVRSVRLSLRYLTEGRGTTDQEVVATEEIPIDPRRAIDAPFTLRVPRSAPISYDGQLIRVVWEIEIRLDRRLATDPRSERGVIVVPAGGHYLYDRPHPLPVHG